MLQKVVSVYTVLGKCKNVRRWRQIMAKSYFPCSNLWKHMQQQHNKLQSRIEYLQCQADISLLSAYPYLETWYIYFLISMYRLNSVPSLWPRLQQSWIRTKRLGTLKVLVSALVFSKPTAAASSKFGSFFQVFSADSGGWMVIESSCRSKTNVYNRIS